MPTDFLAIGKDHPVRSRSLPWYRNSLGNRLSPEARDLFERYSKIPPKDIESHIYELVSHVFGMLRCILCGFISTSLYIPSRVFRII
jgi:hypothetical protein